MTTKDDTAQLLADAHFRLDQGITRIFRIVEPNESNDDLRPLKLLEISSMTTEVGISPVGMTADPARGVSHASVVIEISPNEFERLQRSELKLPNDWQLGPELFPHATARRTEYEPSRGNCTSERDTVLPNWDAAEMARQLKAIRG